MKHLVLGGSGFIGSSFLPFLLRRGDAVRVLDLYPPRLEQGGYSAQDVEFVQGRFEESTDFERLLDGVDVVFHLISTTHAGSRIPYAQEVRENVLPSLALLEACAAKTGCRLVFLSSGGTVYGRYENDVPVKENAPLEPINPYGVQKVCIEKYVELYGALYGLDYRILRPANPYGPLQNPTGGQGALAAFCYAAVRGEGVRIFGDGKVVRDYLYIDDLCRGMVDVALHTGGERVFNMGTGHGSSLLDIVSCIGSTLGKPLDVEYVPGRPSDVPYSVLSMERYCSVFHPPAFVSLQDGVARMVAHYQEQQALGGVHDGK